MYRPHNCSIIVWYYTNITIQNKIDSHPSIFYLSKWSTFTRSTLFIIKPFFFSFSFLLPLNLFAWTFKKISSFSKKKKKISFFFFSFFIYYVIYIIVFLKLISIIVIKSNIILLFLLLSVPISSVLTDSIISIVKIFLFINTL